MTCEADGVGCSIDIGRICEENCGYYLEDHEDDTRRWSKAWNCEVKGAL